MDNLAARPLLRWPLDIQQTVIDGEKVFLVRDQLGVAPDPIVASPPVMFILSLLDGSHSVDEIFERIAPFGFARGELDELMSELDKMYFLQTPRAAERGDTMRREFRDARVRLAALAGRAYSSDPLELKQLMAQFSTEGARHSVEPQGEIPAVIIPHIDYQRGAPGYAAGMRILERIPKPDTIVLIGTSHQPGQSPYILTRKDFASPLGTFPADGPAIDQLARRYGEDRAFGEEFLHRSEHSLELQLPLLAHRYGEDLPKLVPILVGSFQRNLEQRRSPRDDSVLSDFIGALTELLSDRARAGERVLLYGGVDLAHMGTFFGDAERMSDVHLPAIESRDGELLSAIFSGDEAALFEHMAEDTDQRRICGFPSIYTMLAALRDAGHERLRGELVAYHQAVEPISDCIVTFASAYWTNHEQPAL